MNICAIVPSLDPDEALLNVIASLKARGFEHIIVVDDGSSDRHFFEMISDDCDVLHHAVNLGKGRALKTAFNHYLNKYSAFCKGAVILDSDNQHDIEDVCKCSEALLAYPDSLILGVRDFNFDNVPVKSRFGNKITAWVFRMLCGLDISDTQTGLRAVSNECAEIFLDTPGERFEYETNMLLETKRHQISIKEVEIKTIYIDKNKASHFNPLFDSISIYKVLIKFLWASVASFAIDFSLFALFIFMFSSAQESLRIFLATCIARIISSVFNFTLNRNMVFQNRDGVKAPIVKYYILCVLQMMMSYGGVYVLTLLLGFRPVILKIFVDFVLFLISFQVQREWVFKRWKKENS